MEKTQHPGDHSAPGGEMMLDPEVVNLMNNLDLVRRASVRPMTAAEQAQVLGQMIGEKQAHAQKRAAVDDQSQFDEDAMAEAARALKRRRIASNADFSGARKMYACGPEVLPDQSEDSSPNALDDLMFDNQLLGLSAHFGGTYSDEPHDLHSAPDTTKADLVPTYKPGFNLFESVCSSVWLGVEVAKHLGVADIVNLYSTSKTFHALLDGHWQSSIFAWAEHMAPSSFRIFYWKFYGCYTRKDPSGTTWEAPGLFADAFPLPPWAKAKAVTAAHKKVRDVPGLRYLAMLVKREVRVRDILAKMARCGYRLPNKCHEAVKKMWMIMDLPTNVMRRSFIHSTQLWTTEDFYLAQMFIVKLQMLFNSPVLGPDTPLAVETILGARQGLTPLWQILRGKKYTEILEIIQMRVRYIASDQEMRRHRTWEEHYNVPQWELGQGHLEGWGAGNIHLSRPDELIVEEATRRGINLKDHLTFMSFWGHVDWQRRENLVPTEEEMYMSDDELPPLSDHDKGPNGIFGNCGNVPFVYGEWKPKHALLVRWDTLTDEEKLAVKAHVRSDETKMLAHEDDDRGFWELGDLEMSRLNYGKKANTAVSVPESYLSEDDDEKDTKAKNEEHKRNCTCEECITWANTNDIEEHDIDCLCSECLDAVDYDAEAEDDSDDEELEDEEEEDDDDFAHESDFPVDPADPMPREVLLDRTLRAAWNTIEPDQREEINATLDMQQGFGNALVTDTSGIARQLGARREFPNITDPVSLALLHKLDVVQSMHTGGQNATDPGVSGDSNMADDGDEDEEMLDEGQKEQESVASIAAKHHAANRAADDAASDSSMDDEQLKALADLDYSDDELEVDLGRFEAMLARGRNDGSYHYGTGGGAEGDSDGDDEDAFGVAHEDDLKSPGLAAEMWLPDTFNY